MWKRSMISDRHVCEAYYTRSVCGKFASTILEEVFPNCPPKVIYAAMKRADDNGYLDYGVSLRSGWLTDAGKALLLSGFRFKIGDTYETQAGDLVTVVGRSGSVGYECVLCNDDLYRYDRSTTSHDAGRVTGTNHDYSYPDNFRRGNGV